MGSKQSSKMGNKQTSEVQDQNTLQNYRIDYENIIKRGTFCCLYKGYAPDNSTIAIKEYHESKGCAAKIKSYLNALKGLQDPNVVQILDFGEIDKKFLIATEYCNDSLDSFRRKAKNNKVNLQDIVNIGKQIGNGVRAMVNFGVIFNNLHMKNILIGQGSTVKISVPSIKTSSSWQIESFGSSYYIAPEIWFDQCGNGPENQQNALMFSIGAILLHLAVGESYPFKCPNTPDVHIQNIFNGVPVVLRGIFLELLKKNPEERLKLKKFCLEIRGFTGPQLKQKKLFDKQHVESAIQDRNKSTTKAENTVVSYSKSEGVSIFVLPLTLLGPMLIKINMVLANINKTKAVSK